MKFQEPAKAIKLPEQGGAGLLGKERWYVLLADV
jgi:hypothetical protein